MIQIGIQRASMGAIRNVSGAGVRGGIVGRMSGGALRLPAQRRGRLPRGWIDTVSLSQQGRRFVSDATSLQSILLVRNPIIASIREISTVSNSIANIVSNGNICMSTIICEPFLDDDGG